MRCPFGEARSGVMRECEPGCALRVEVEECGTDPETGKVRASRALACTVAVIASRAGRFCEVSNIEEG